MYGGLYGMDGFGMVVVCLVVMGAFLVGMSYLCIKVLNSIKNPRLFRCVFVILCILFLPVMLCIWSTNKLTNSEKMLAPFSFSLRARSKLVVISLMLYIALYYYLFTLILQALR